MTECNMNSQHVRIEERDRFVTRSSCEVGTITSHQVSLEDQQLSSLLSSIDQDKAIVVNHS